MSHAAGEKALFKIVKKIKEAYIKNCSSSPFFSEADFKNFFHEELKQNGAVVKIVSENSLSSPGHDLILKGNNGHKDLYVRLIFSWGKTIPEVEKWVGEELEKLNGHNNSYLFFYDQSGKLVGKDISKVARNVKNTKTKVIYFNLENREIYTYPPGFKDAIN